MPDTKDGIVIGANQINGNFLPRAGPYTGAELVELLVGDDYGPEITLLSLQAKTSDGKLVDVRIGNNEDGTISVSFCDEADQT